MMAHLRDVASDYRVLWRMTLSARHRHARFYVLGLTVVATLSMAVLVFADRRDPVATLIASACMALGAFVLGWTVQFLFHVVPLNTPFTARLVPRMRRRLMGLTATVWTAATVAMTVLALGTPLSASAAFLTMGTFLVTLGLARSGHWVGVTAQCLMFLVIPLRDTVVGTVLQQLTQGAGLVLGSLLMFVLGACALRMMFMNGGERHFEMRKAQQLQADRLSAEGQFREHGSNRVAMGVYLTALRRDCRAGDSGRLLAHLFGARDHWTYQVLALGGTALLVGAGMLAARTYGGETVSAMLANSGWMIVIGALLLPLFEHERSNVHLRDTRDEQALLRLAPRMPAAAPVFNRTLARVLLGNAVFGWCLQVAAVMWLSFASGTDGGSASFFLTQFCVCCLTLPLLATNLRDHARRDKVHGLGPLLVLLVCAGISFAIGGIAASVLGTPVLPVAALVSILIALVVVPRRWQQGIDAPHAFPVGRLA